MLGRKRIKKRTLLLAGGVFCVFMVFFVPKVWQGGLQKANAAQENPFGWEKMSAYTTYFNENDGGRCANIAIAASLIDGVTVQAYGEFSFNATVGKRTQEAGFQNAKIIVGGEYVLGVGGGVCQVSTTLYNAALKSGMEIVEYHPHSLAVGYVAPSRDAMVSTQSDFKFFNPHGFAVHIRVQTENGSVKAAFYGKNTGDRYEIVTRILEEIPPPQPIVKTGEYEEILRAEKAGVKSEMYLEKYRGKRLLFRKRLRVDEYRPIQGIIVKKNEFST